MARHARTGAARECERRRCNQSIILTMASQTRTTPASRTAVSRAASVKELQADADSVDFDFAAEQRSRSPTVL